MWSKNNKLKTPTIATEWGVGPVNSRVLLIDCIMIPNAFLFNQQLTFYLFTDSLFGFLPCNIPVSREPNQRGLDTTILLLSVDLLHRDKHMKCDILPKFSNKKLCTQVTNQWRSKGDRPQ